MNQSEGDTQKQQQSQEERLTQKDQQPSVDIVEEAQMAEEPAAEPAEMQPESGRQLSTDQPESEVEKLQNQLLRLSADIENMRRRNQQDIARAHSYGLEKCFRELMPVLDSLAMALTNTEEAQRKDNPLYQGVELTCQMLIRALEKFGLSKVEPAIKDAFKPELHEAMTIAPTTDMPANCVVEVIQCGYILHDRLLRPARVVVSKSAD